MGILVVIDGREAIPIRAIPFVSGWTMSPDLVAKSFAKRDHWVTRLEGVAAYFLSVEGTYSLMHAKEWDGPVADLQILSDKLKSTEVMEQENYPVWRQQSILRLPASCFVWRDEFEEAFRHAYSPEHLILPDERPGDRELNFSPRIPEESALAVMQGFSVIQLGVDASSVAKQLCPKDGEALPNPNIGMTVSTPELFESLATALEGWFDKPLDALPGELRQRVETKLSLIPWENLSADGRRSIAAQWDCQNDPALEDSRAAGLEAAIVDWGYWQKLTSLTAQEFCILRHVHDPRKFDDERNSIPGGVGKPLGERVSDDLRIIDRSLGSDTKNSIKNWIIWAQKHSWDIPVYLRPLVEEDEARPKPKDHLNHDPEMQKRANEIAAEKKKEKKGAVTRDKVGKLLAQELEMDPETVIRRIRKEW
jgi:hypothetical protein